MSSNRLYGPYSTYKKIVDQLILERKITITADGSSSIFLPEWNEQYHSKHGAITEAQHVFIKNGLHCLLSKNNAKEINILEIGFGTGLNAFLTLFEAERLRLNICYDAVEAYPVTLDDVNSLNYSKIFPEGKDYFLKMHQHNWEESHPITTTFQLKKRKILFEEIEDKDVFDLIYFDAFGARVQPELWTVAIFQKMFDALKNQGILVTYSAKGSVRRAMQEVGFTVEKLVGPPGKREMLRANKI